MKQRAVGAAFINFLTYWSTFMDLSVSDNKFQNQNKTQEKAGEQQQHKSGFSEIGQKIKRRLEAVPTEGRTTRMVEDFTAKMPSLGYMGLAVGAMAASAAIASFSRKKELANFVGLWAPSFLIVGLYNKIVKIEHEMAENFQNRERR